MNKKQTHKQTKLKKKKETKKKMKQIKFLKSNLYRKEGIFQYDDNHFVVHLSEVESIEVEWNHITALLLEYNPFSHCKLFIELENKQIIKKHNRRCLYLTLENKMDLVVLEQFFKEKGLDKLPCPNRYQTRYPLLKMYSKRLRIFFHYVEIVMNVMMFMLLFINMYRTIDKYTGIFTNIQNMIFNIDDWAIEHIPTVQKIVSYSISPGVTVYKVLNYIATAIDNISDTIFYIMTLAFYVYNYWKFIVGSIKLPLSIFLWLASFFDKWRDKRAKEKLRTE